MRARMITSSVRNRANRYLGYPVSCLTSSAAQSLASIGRVLPFAQVGQAAGEPGSPSLHCHDARRPIGVISR